MSFFQKQSTLRQRLVVLVLVPLLGVLFFSTSLLREKLILSDKITNIQKLAEYASLSSAFVHEMQKERGMSAGFLGSKGDKFKGKIEQQRQLTNTKRDDLKSFLSGFKRENFNKTFNEKLDEGLRHINNLEKTRTEVTALRITLPNALGFYTTSNRIFLETIAESSQMSPEPSLSLIITAYENFLQAKERTGIERAVLSNVFAKGEFSGNTYQKFITLMAQQDAYLYQFSLFAQDEQRNFYAKAINTSEVKTVENMRKIALALAKGETVQLPDAELWFQTITSKINSYKEVEDNLALTLVNKTKELKSGIFFLIMMVSGVVFATIIVAFFISRSINKIMTDLIYSISNSAEQVSAAAAEISRSSQLLADGATSQAANLEEASASMKEISSQAQENENNATNVKGEVEELYAGLIETFNHSSEVDSQTKETSTEVNQGAKIMGQISGAMAEIKNSSEGIGEILELIREITQQTKMLSTNAAIEAARAGESGKGFAVVADEISKLAENSKAATKDIEKLINDDINSAQNGAKRAKEGEDIFNTIQAKTKNVLGLASQTLQNSEAQQAKSKRVQDMVVLIHRASQFQSRGTSEIFDALVKLDEITQSNAATSEEAASAAEELSAQAKTMWEIVANAAKMVGISSIDEQTVQVQVDSSERLLPRHSNF
ncbi:MAG: nitrate- and nitrite sensing domain-containing protein [SAR324 cluster bacterium]|nr:nitrate- and nitrite sensing domain-containing protein [SAR324 cluster bacterium]